MMTTTERPLHGAIAAAVLGVLGLALGAAVLVWSWNTLAAGLFGLPAAAFRHGLAAEAGLVTVFALRRLGEWRPSRRRTTTP